MSGSRFTVLYFLIYPFGVNSKGAFPVDKAAITYEDAQEMIANNIGLDLLCEHPDFMFRRIVAKTGKYDDVLFRDPEPLVREAVADNGSHLDDLYRDQSRFVRLTVAHKGSHLESLWNDEDDEIRYVVMSHGFFDPRMFDDPCPDNRAYARKKFGHLL